MVKCYPEKDRFLKNILYIKIFEFIKCPCYHETKQSKNNKLEINYV